jgi:hypothetical protein
MRPRSPFRIPQSIIFRCAVRSGRSKPKTTSMPSLRFAWGR